MVFSYIHTAPMSPTLCLNMIVKNESRIIQRLLLSVKEVIDCYCICDTGSTDNTVELIKAFGAKYNIPGRVIQEPFRNFEYNRSFALKACDAMDADYILLLDADMIFWLNPKLTGAKFKELLAVHGAFFMFQGSDAMYYKNTRIVKNGSGFSYKGVTHEYVEVPSQFSQGSLSKELVFIRDIGDGGAKSDKFSRDVRLLKEGLEEDPNNVRYMFYLANSLKDLAGTQRFQTDREIDQMESTLQGWSSQLSTYPHLITLVKQMQTHKDQFRKEMERLEVELKKEAISYYEQRIQGGGFWEEVWYSYFNMGKLYLELEEIEKAMYCFERSFILYPQRVENIYEMVRYYRDHSEHQMAAHFYLMGREAKRKYQSRDYMFIQRDIYDYRLDYEMTIVGYYANPSHLDLGRLCMEVMSQRGIDETLCRNIMCNYKFYAPSLNDEDTEKSAKDNLGALLSGLGNATLDIPSQKFPHFVNSTPTFCKDPNNPHSMYGMIRYVNYAVNDQGGYDQKEFIETKNVLAHLVQDSTSGEWHLEKEGFLHYDSSHDNLYVGLEDMRLFAMDGKIYYTANRGLGYGNMVIEHGSINRVNFKTEDARFLKIDNQRNVEKNWVMFCNDGHTMRMVYNWYPMVLGTIDHDQFVISHKMETPMCFKFFRGSTNGIVIGDEIWFLCHIVSYEDRRYYYHAMVMLDKQTLVLKNYTKMFTFGGDKVEYCLGLDKIGDDELLLGYSVMDRTTRYMSVKQSWFRSQQIR